MVRLFNFRQGHSSCSLSREYDVVQSYVNREYVFAPRSHVRLKAEKNPRLNPFR